MQRLIAAIAVVSLAGGCATVVPVEPADLVLTGGRVFTGDARAPWAEAVAVRGESIVAVGEGRAVRRHVGPQTRVVRLRGRVVVPGINDAHVHVPWGIGPESIELPADGGTAALLEAIRALVLERPLGSWIRAELPPALPFEGLDRIGLDAVAPSHPVRLDTLGGHAAVLNSAALAEWGIARKMPDPPGGWYGRDRAGRLDGWIYEHALWIARAAEAGRASDAEIRAQLEGFAAAAARFGITSIQTMPLLSPSRTEHLLIGIDPPLRWRVIELRMGTLPDGSSSHRPLKYILDGTPIERNAALRAPYADREGWRGRLNYAPGTIAEMMRRAASGPRPLLVHAAGDAAVRVVLDAMKGTSTDGWPRRRVRIEHADGLTGEMLADAAALGVVVVQNPSHFALAELVQARLGPERAAEFMKARTLIERGIPFALGSDGPLDPWLNVMLAAMHPSNPAEALTVEQAVRAYTAGSAFAEMEESRKGTIAPGMLADLAVLSQNVFEVPLSELPNTESELTIVGGRIVWEREDEP
ncbi:MAG TPA: amidohydrolase [Thermoanaerobaculia bacterium]|nr:amidohydrolase [Thermoanaerobaculia bacterium]